MVVASQVCMDCPRSVPGCGYKKFQAFRQWMRAGDATDHHEPSGLRVVFSGHPCPEIAGSERNTRNF